MTSKSACNHYIAYASRVSDNIIWAEYANRKETTTIVNHNYCQFREQWPSELLSLVKTEIRRVGDPQKLLASVDV